MARNNRTPVHPSKSKQDRMKPDARPRVMEANARRTAMQDAARRRRGVAGYFGKGA